MLKFAKLIQVTSIVLFLPFLILIYAYLPENVVLTESNVGIRGMVINKESFFYSILFTFVLTNILFISIGRVLQIYPARQISTGITTFYTEATKKSILVWIKSFSFLLNIIFMMVLTYFTMLNYSEHVKSNFNFLIYAGPVLVGLWLLIFIIILARRTKA